MAFLPQPALPRSTRRTSQVRVSVRAAAGDRYISVSRRRRLFDFTQANNQLLANIKGEKASQTAKQLNSGPSTSSDFPVPTRSAAQVRDDISNAEALRQAAIQHDAEAKKTSWEHQLSLLRTPSIPAPIDYTDRATSAKPTTPDASSAPPVVTDAVAVSPSAEPPIPADSSISDRHAPPAAPAAEGEKTAPSKKFDGPIESLGEKAEKVKEDAEQQVQEAVEAAQDRGKGFLEGMRGRVENMFGGVQDRVEDVVEDAQEFVEDAVEDAQEFVEDAVEDAQEFVEDAVEDAQEFVEDAVEDIQERVTDVRDGVEDAVDDLRDRFFGETDEEPKESKVEEAVSPRTERSIGESIIEAIVEGVPTVDAPGEASSVDKSDLIELIDSGKVKNLTVTKLRRLLSKNRLKTSGRKAELIARLTSFAKAK